MFDPICKFFSNPSHRLPYNPSRSLSSQHERRPDGEAVAERAAALGAAAHLPARPHRPSPAHNNRNQPEPRTLVRAHVHELGQQEGRAERLLAWAGKMHHPCPPPPRSLRLTPLRHPGSSDARTTPRTSIACSSGRTIPRKASSSPGIASRRAGRRHTPTMPTAARRPTAPPARTTSTTPTPCQLIASTTRAYEPTRLEPRARTSTYVLYLGPNPAGRLVGAADGAHHDGRA